MILLVEDDEKLRRMVSDFLTAKGYDVVAAENGEKALSRLYGLDPEIILLDINLPDISGIDVCRRIRKVMGGTVPIVFLTAYDDADHVESALKAGGNDYVLKTTSLATLLGRIKHWLSAKSPN